MSSINRCDKRLRRFDDCEDVPVHKLASSGENANINQVFPLYDGLCK